MHYLIIGLILGMLIGLGIEEYFPQIKILPTLAVVSCVVIGIMAKDYSDKKKARERTGEHP